MLTEQEVSVIEKIIENGHDVEIQKRKNGIAILSVRKDIKYIEAKGKKVTDNDCKALEHN